MRRQEAEGGCWLVCVGGGGVKFIFGRWVSRASMIYAWVSGGLGSRQTGLDDFGGERRKKNAKGAKVALRSLRKDRQLQEQPQVFRLHHSQIARVVSARMTDFLAGVDVVIRGLVGSGRGFAGLYFFEEPDYAYAEEAEEGEPAEDVDEGPVGGLAA